MNADEVHPRVRRNITELGWIAWNKRPGKPDRGVLTELGALALNPPQPPREQTPVFLTPARDARCYTGNPGKADLQAGEVLDPAIVKRYTRVVRAQEREQRETRAQQERIDREALDLEDRLKRVMADASKGHVALKSEFNALRRTLQRPPSPEVKQAVVRRLRAVERVLYERKAA